jgi:hypothetical protein
VVSKWLVDVVKTTGLAFVAALIVMLATAAKVGAAEVAMPNVKFV